MNRRTKSGLLITYSDFWLDKLTHQGEPYFRVSTVRCNDKSIPISHKEAKEFFLRSDAEFTDSAEDYVDYLLGWATRY